jgi:hypothetical protein
MSYGRFVSMVGALLFLGCSAAYACNPGDIHCENGYKFTCKCWTISGCNYEADGTCYRDDGHSGTAPHVNLPRNKYVREARLVCASFHATLLPEACDER